MNKERKNITIQYPELNHEECIANIIIKTTEIEGNICIENVHGWDWKNGMFINIINFGKTEIAH